MTLWFSARHSVLDTPQVIAAACSSICLVAAPQARIGWMKWRMLREPSVSWLPYFCSLPGAWMILTRAQSASISSATTMGRLVRDPVPISERCVTMLTVPSGAMDTNTCGSQTTPPGMPSAPVL